LNLGIALGKAGRYAEAIKELTRAIELNPQDPQAFISRGTAFEFLGDRNRSRSDFMTAVELEGKGRKSESGREPVNMARLRAIINAR
jgi:Flp pilus assembly protein TadD